MTLKTALPPVYTLVNNANLEANQASYEFAKSMIAAIRKLLSGSLSQTLLVERILVALNQDASYYEKTFEDLIDALPNSHCGQGAKSLPIACLSLAGSDIWTSKTAEQLDSIRNNFKSMEDKLKYTIEKKKNTTFTTKVLTRALYCFADFYTLAELLSVKDNFLKDVLKKDNINCAKKRFTEKLIALFNQFAQGLEELDQEHNATVSQNNKVKGENTMMTNVQLIHIEELFSHLLDTLPWEIISVLELEDLTVHFKENLLVVDSSIQKLSLGLNDQDTGAILFFRTINNKWYMLSVCTEDGYTDELVVERFNSKEDFLIALAALLNDWNPHFDIVLEEKDFTLSTQADVEHAISMML